MMSELNELKKFSHTLTIESGKVIKKYFRTGVNVETKSDESPVTIADKQTEEVMRALIEKEFPEHGILGEEFGVVNEGAEYQWILDPIDGTKSFITGAVTFGTLIALTKNGQPILGVINQPILEEFLIGDNNETKLNDSVVQVRECNNLKDATLLASDHLMFGVYQNQDAFERLIRKVKMYRMWGDCYGYYLLATGYADIMLDPIMSVWDSMALIPVVRGAGGVITDYKGGDPVKGSSTVAAPKGIHKLVIDELNNY